MLTLVLLCGVLAQEWPVEIPLPAGFDPTKPFRVVRADNAKEVAARATATSIVLFTTNDGAVYRLESAQPSSYQKVEVGDDGHCIDLRLDSKTQDLLVSGKNLLRYHYTVVEQPDPLFSRSGYLHPVWTPGGKTITNDSPPNHLHHHGIWSAWTSSEFEGRKSNFWESKENQGRIECVKVEETTSGPLFGGFKARHRFINLNAPDGPKAALDEVWEVRAYALPTLNVFDLVSTQTTATDKPLVIKEYRYGGIGFRGAADWEGKTGVSFLTSEGKSRVEGHATKAKWVLASGKVDGVLVSIGFLCHPSNFRAPQPLRIHPDEPFFNWAVPQGGDFSIEPGKPYIARYRFIVADRTLTAEEMNGAWSAYGEAPKISLSIAK